MRMPAGGGFNEDITQFAMIIAGIFLIVFFLLALRLEWDKHQGDKVQLKPTRDPRPLIQSVIRERNQKKSKSTVSQVV